MWLLCVARIGWGGEKSSQQLIAVERGSGWWWKSEKEWCIDCEICCRGPNMCMLLDKKKYEWIARLIFFTDRLLIKMERLPSARYKLILLRSSRAQIDSSSFVLSMQSSYISINRFAVLVCIGSSARIINMLLPALNRLTRSIWHRSMFHECEIVSCSWTLLKSFNFERVFTLLFAAAAIFCGIAENQDSVVISRESQRWNGFFVSLRNVFFYWRILLLLDFFRKSQRQRESWILRRISSARLCRASSSFAVSRLQLFGLYCSYTLITY